jgi:hypothetical protein
VGAIRGYRRLSSTTFWGPERDYDADALRPPMALQRSHVGQLPAEVLHLVDQVKRV